jgi:hypothetical protein
MSVLASIDIMRANPDTYPASDRHQASVLNSEYPSDQARRLLQDLDNGHALIVRTDTRDFEVAANLGDYGVFVEGRIVHKNEAEPGEFDGWFIGEERYGLSHPLLLLEPTRVFERGTGPHPPRLS